MTKEEAARILDPETSRDELWKYEADTRLAACNEACRMGADALRAQQEREHPKQITNADRIRAMSDEEMAEKLGRGPGCPVNGDCEKMSMDCNACWLDWLQQTAEEG